MDQRYILFIDESGKTKLSDPGDHFLLSGLIVNRDLHTALSHYMISLKEKSDIPTDENIHAFDLFEDEKRRVREPPGKLVSRRIVYSKIDTFFGRLMSLVEGANMQALLFRIDKAPYMARIRRVARTKSATEKAVINYLKRNDLHDILYETLARKMILEFGHFLEQEDAIGEVMAESRRDADATVLSAFLASTKDSTFSGNPRYAHWSECCRKRVTGLTFQNKKGLSFGLEIADLFGWAHFYSEFGSTHPASSTAKKRRVDARVERTEEAMETLYKKQPEDMTDARTRSVAADRVSEFTESLKNFRSTSGASGTLPGIPSRP